MAGRLLLEERNWKSLGLKYQIYDDKLRIQTLLIFYTFDIPLKDIVKVELGQRPVIWDIIKKGYCKPEYGFGFRIIKNDLADLSKHVTIEKSGFWRQIRITPREPEKFMQTLTKAMK